MKMHIILSKECFSNICLKTKKIWLIFRPTIKRLAGRKKHIYEPASVQEKYSIYFSETKKKQMEPMLIE